MNEISTPDSPLLTELQSLLNRHSAENGSNTPDFILADYLIRCLDVFDDVVRSRAAWYGRLDKPGQGSTKG